MSTTPGKSTNAHRVRTPGFYLGAAALVALTAMGGFGVASGGRAGQAPTTLAITDVDTSTTSGTTSTTTSSTTSTSTTSTSTTTTTTSSQADQALQTLYGLLPPGYNSSNCAPSPHPNARALATVDCAEPANATGPTSARFSVFADSAALAGEFQSGVNEDAATECPGGIQSPTSWHMDATPDVPAGSILCGTYNNAPDFMWTKTDALLLGDIQGPDLDTLYGYWVSL